MKGRLTVEELGRAIVAKGFGHIDAGGGSGRIIIDRRGRQIARLTTEQARAWVAAGCPVPW